MPAWCGAGIQWDEPWHIRSNGQQLSVETFMSGMPPDAVVQKLVQRNGAYQRYLVADGRILLSGVSDGAHWLAEVKGRAEGAQGYVSALYFDAARAGTPFIAARTTPGEPPWKAQRAGLRQIQIFDFETSARIALVQAPVPGPGGPAEPSAAADGAAAAPSGLDAGEYGRFTLIPLESHAPMALAILMPEN